MNYLLDTHIAIWTVFDPDKLTESQWEISLKFPLGKLDLGGRTPVEFIASMYDLGTKNITPSPDQ